MIKDTIHAIKRQWHLKRFGVDIDVEYEPLSDEDFLKDARDTFESLGYQKEWLAEIKKNPVRNFLEIRDLKERISRYEDYHELDMEDLKERGLSL